MLHERFMRTALREARRGVGLTSPNPAVGAVLVQAGRVVGRGWHRRAGWPHAEIEALASLPHPEAARGGTLYVTLEPCSTHGRTPPCTEAILAAGVRRVVIGARDPNPLHAGRGLDRLREAGVEVIEGVLERECAFLNRAFFRWITTGRPWVIAKAALSLDGRLARPPGEGQWLSGAAARRDAHRLRSEVDAILVGAHTLRVDNPRLTVRIPGPDSGKVQPWRVVLTRGGQPLPAQAHLFTDAFRERTLVFEGRPLESVLEELGGRLRVNSVLVEGGAEVLGGFFDQGLVDEVCFYLTPWVCGGPTLGIGGVGVGSSEEGVRLRGVEYRRMGRDVRMTGLVDRSGGAEAEG
ncbi:MAG: Riboflavin biosynthesis protein RibD [Verrucomicrobiota bacterium]|jgi:diaminohydroxyphosphoribosylaminopyrimidine deaminase/5-amino-6-(5-phosphoribosylamino)uracil reductase